MKIIHLLHAIIFLACVHPLLHAAKPAWVARTAARTQHTIDGIYQSNITRVAGMVACAATECFIVTVAKNSCIYSKDGQLDIQWLPLASMVGSMLANVTLNYHLFIRPLLQDLARQDNSAHNREPFSLPNLMAQKGNQAPI